MSTVSDDLKLRQAVARGERASSILVNRDMQAVLNELKQHTHDEIDRAEDLDIAALQALKIRLSGIKGITTELKKWVNEGKRAQHALDEQRNIIRGEN